MTTNLFLAAQGNAGGGGMSMIIMLVLMFAVMYFFMIRPQQKRQKEIRNFQNSLQVGSKVVTSSGVYGEVRHIDLEKNIIDLEIAKGVVIKIDRGSVFAEPQPQVAK